MAQQTLPIRKKRNPTNLIMSGLGLLFFAIAAYMIYKQLSQYTFVEIRDAILNVPAKNLMFAGLAAFLSYMVLSLYDFLALKYIGKRSFIFRWMMAGFAGFAVSNNAGHAIVSGTAIRYHLYRRWGFTIPDIIKMVTFSTFTYTIGCFALLIVGFVLTPEGTIGNVSRLLTVSLVIFSIVSLTVYLTSAIFVKKKLTIGTFTLEIPSFKQAISQIVIGSSDVILASLVLYSVLAPTIDLPFGTFLGVFLIAQVLGTFSQVPGGVGVFESIFFYVLADTDEKEIPLIAGLVVYRLFYYVLPLLVAAVMVGIYEFRFNQGKRRLFKKWGRKR